MQKKIRKLVLNKYNGNVTSLFSGQMFMLVFLIWCLFSFRLTMLKTVFYYIDDALTSSTLGSALINIEEYGKSNQVLLNDNEKYNAVTTNASTHGWTSKEAAILLSEYNAGSDLILGPDILPMKTTYSKDNRIKNSLEYDYKYDKYLIQSISALLGNFAYNSTNGTGKAVGDINVENKLSNVGPTVVNKNQMTFSDELFKNTLLGNFIDGGITLSRVDIYTVYNQTLAEMKTYKSAYFDTIVNDDLTAYAQWKSGMPTTPDEFDAMYKPTDTTAEDYGAKYDLYEIKRQIFMNDYNAAQSGNLICFIDTHTTYQNKTPISNLPYKYYYLTDSKLPVNQTTELLKPYSIPISVDDNTKYEEPIKTGYSLYSLDCSGGGTSTDFTYTELQPNAQEIKIPDGRKMAGTDIKQSAIYTEINFKVKTFPGDLGEIMGTKEATLARLIDIELAE